MLGGEGMRGFSSTFFEPGKSSTIRSACDSLNGPHAHSPSRRKTIHWRCHANPTASSQGIFKIFEMSTSQFTSTLTRQIVSDCYLTTPVQTLDPNDAEYMEWCNPLRGRKHPRQMTDDERFIASLRRTPPIDIPRHRRTPHLRFTSDTIM